MENSEIKSAIEALGTEARDSFAAITTEQGAMREMIENERREREDLELRLTRKGVAGRRSPREELKSFFGEYMRNGEVKAMSVGADPSGGYAVPVDLDAMVLDMLTSISPIRSIATAAASTTGDYEKLIGRRGASSGWSGETATRTATATPTLSKIRPPGGELYALAEVTSWLLDDAAFDAAAYLEDHVLTEFAVQEGAAFVAGDGLSKPRGFLSYAAVTDGDDVRAFDALQYHPTGEAASFPTDDPADVLIDFVHKLAPPYRANATWVMNSTTAGVLRKFKTTSGDYVWQPSLIAGQPDRLLGYPVFYAEDMPNIGANAFPIAFGDFRRGYLVVDKAQMRMVRDPYTKKGSVIFYMARRVHGSVADPNAIKLLKVAAT